MGMLSQSKRDSSLPKRILMETVVQRFPKRFEDFSFPLIKQLLKNCRPCGVQNQEHTQQMLFLSQSERFVAFFWQPPACVGGVHTAFLKGCSEVEWAPEEACVMGDDALQPCEGAELALVLDTSLRSAQAALLCWLSEEMLVCSAGINELLSLSVEVKAELLVKEWKCTSLMVHPEHPFHASPPPRRLCQTSAGVESFWQVSGA